VKPPAWIRIALVVAVFAAYAPVARYDFVDYDDDEYVVQNVHVRRGVTLPGVTWAFTHAHSANWHPVTWLSHMVDCQLFGLAPGPHHVVSVALHALTAVVLLGVLARATGAPWPSAFVAFLFALHPLRVESVAWVAERKDVLAGLFWMLTLAAYVAWVQRGGRWRWALVVVAFAFGLMAKPMVVTLPFVLLLLDWWPLGRFASRSPAALVWEKIPLVVLALADGVATILAQRAGGAIASLASVPVATRIANALVSYVAYVRLLVWPADLAVFYPRRALAPWEIAGAAAILVAVSAVAVRARRRAPWALVGWLWYVVTLLPVIGLVQVGEQARADRFTYVPEIGLAIVAAWGGCALLPRVVRPLAATAVLVVLTVLTRRQVAVWENGITLFGHALAVTDGSYVAETNLGVALVAAGRPDDAMAHELAALRLRPDDAKTHVNVGLLLAARGDRTGAAEHYQAALARDPGYATAHYDFGLLLAEDGRLDEAIAEYRAALRIDPDYARAWTNLGWALAAAGRLEEAVGAYRRAIDVDPELAVAHNNLGVALENLGRIDDAIAAYAEGTRLLPAEPQAHFNLAAVLAANGRAAEAIPHLETVVRLRPDAADAHAALAAACAAAGRFPEAVAAGERAYALALAGGRDDLATTVRDRLAAYRAGRPAP